MDALTDNERYIVEAVRSLNPFEKIIIEADKLGKPNNYLLARSTQVMLTNETPIFVKAYRI